MTYLFGSASAQSKPDKQGWMSQVQARANQLSELFPLNRHGSAYNFVHKSFYEYLITASIVDLIEANPLFERAVLGISQATSHSN